MLIKPKNWVDFQHYKDRSPPWIKLHHRLLDNYEFHLMQDASKSLAMCLWLIASEHLDGEIDATPSKLSFRLRMPEDKIKKSLKELIENGFFTAVEDASTMLAERKHVAPLDREEAEVETETETALSSPAAPKNDFVPYEKIVSLYHEHLPTCPKVAKLTAKRKGQIAARWKSGDIPDLDTWQEYFIFVSKSKFLTGFCDPAEGKKRFVADLEWITNETNFTKIWEKKYHGEV